MSYGRRMLVGREMLVGAADSPDGFQRGIPVAYGGGDGLHTQTRMPQEPRELPIGLIQLAVAASGTATVQTKPQVLFRGERLMLEPVVTAVNFDLQDVKIGKDSQLAAADFNIFGAAFSPTAVGSRMQLDTAEPGILITIIAVNTDAGAAHAFKAALFGTVLD